MLMITRKKKNRELVAKNKKQNVFYRLLPFLNFYLWMKSITTNLKNITIINSFI